MAEEAAWAGVIVSLVSLVVAIFAFRKSVQASDEANSFQQRLVEIEEHREKDRLSANLRAELRKTERSYRLYLINDGAVEATNVSVKMDGDQLKDHPAGSASKDLGSVIGPSSEISCMLMVHRGCMPPFDIELTWNDDSGQQRSYKSTLTF